MLSPVSAFPRTFRRRRVVRTRTVRRRTGASAPQLGRTVETQTPRGRGRRPNLSKGLLPVGFAQRLGAGNVATQTGSGVKTVSSKAVKKSKPQFKGMSKQVQIRSPTQFMFANTRILKQIYQAMTELEVGFGSRTLRNSTLPGGQLPLHMHCLTTIDRPNMDLGDEFPQFLLQNDTQFTKGGIGVVFGNQNENIGSLALAGRLFLDNVRIKLLFHARPNRQTTYTIDIIRFKGNSQHLAPYLNPEEGLALSGLSSDQLSERKAFWIDHMMRHLTVNPVAITKHGLSRMKKYYEVIYHREMTLDEGIKDSQEAENNRVYEQINLPVKAMRNFNYNVNNRYDLRTDQERADATLNTDIIDIVDDKTCHKSSLHGNLWLMIRANNTTQTPTEQSEGTGNSLPTYDISWEAQYRTFTTQ